ncbi:hypothetical protein MMC16_000616 [Acarospora aff. strigata]|nr:hypothetical protein [Acarospora aff. strigata]
MEVFWAAPPVTRTLTAATLATSCLVHSQLLAGRRVIFYLPWVLKFPPELWRVVSAFLITGPGLGIILDTYFLYTYGSSLETECTRFSQPGSFFVYIIFVSAVILVTAGGFLGALVFTSALTLALAYTYSQDNRNRKVTLFIVTIPVPYLPYAMLLITFVMGGPGMALQQATGLLAAHLYDFLTRIYPTFGGGRNYIQTPAIVQRWFGATSRSAAARGYGTAYRPPTQQPSQGRSSGIGGGMSSLWGGRGAGRRLGGD